MAILYLSCFSLGVLATIVGYIVLTRQATYTGLTIDDLIDYFQQVNQQILLETANQSDEEPHYGWTSYVYRRQLRLKLDLLKDYLQRMSHNTARPGHVAHSDLAKMRQHKLVYPPESIKALHDVLDADREFAKLARSTLRKIWLWSLTRFHDRTWGPVPNIQDFQIPKLIEAYNHVKRAAEAYALFYGEVGRLISEEISAKM